MRSILTLIFLFLSTLSFGQYYKDIVTDKAIITYPDHTVTVYLKPVKQEIFPKTENFYFWYSSNQIKMTQGGFSGKLLNGNYTDLYKNRNLKEQGQFRNGLKTGKWNNWTETGILKETISWNSGSKSGRYIKYDSTGRPLEKGRYKNNLLNGTQTIYISADSTQTPYYKNGKPAVKKSIFPSFIERLYQKIKF